MNSSFKALTFRASAIGDCLMGKYFLENIHAQYPDARLGIVVANRGGMIRDLCAAYPWLHVIEANRRSPQALYALLRDFHGSDLVLTQYAGKHGGSFGFASKCAARILAAQGGLVGFSDASRWNGLLYDKLLPIRSQDAVAEHEREALRAAGVTVSLPYPTLEYIKHPGVLKTFGVRAGEFVIVHMFAGNRKRGVSPSQGRNLLTALQVRLSPHISVLVSGSSADRKIAEGVVRGTGAKSIAGEATLQDMMNLIGESAGVVSVDTGMAHVAAQLGKSLVVLRTCLGPNWWFRGQYGSEAPIVVVDNDRACAHGHVIRDYPSCIDGIDMNEVASRVADSV